MKVKEEVKKLTKIDGSTLKELDDITPEEIQAIKFKVNTDLLIDILETVNELCEQTGFNKDNFLIINGLKQLDVKPVPISAIEIENIEKEHDIKLSPEKIRELEKNTAEKKEVDKATQEVYKFTIDLAKLFFTEYDKKKRKPGYFLGKIVSLISQASKIPEKVLLDAHYPIIVSLFKRLIFDNQESFKDSFL